VRKHVGVDIDEAGLQRAAHRPAFDDARVVARDGHRSPRGGTIKRRRCERLLIALRMKPRSPREGCIRITKVIAEP
jgi:hypothetical protein